MSIWRFEPEINGKHVVDDAGNTVAVEVEVDEDPEKVDVVVSVDGKEVKSDYLLPDSVYHWLKWIALLLLPTMAWMCTALDDVWILPYGDQISMTLNIIGTAIAVLIGVSTLKNEV